MGKKSRNVKKAQRKVERDAARRTQGRWTVVDSRGCMAYSEYLRMYNLWNFLAEVAYPRIEEQRRKKRGPLYKPLEWTFKDGMDANPNEYRVVMANGILTNIDWLVEQIDTGLYDSTFRRHYRRAITGEDRAEIRSWKLHVEDDFFLVDHIPYKGSVFVQVGRKRKGTTSSESTAHEVAHEDVHEPRCFLVKGLAQPLTKLSEKLVKFFEYTSRAIRDKYPEFPWLCVVHAAILPWNRGLTVANSLQPPQEQSHFLTPEDFSEAAKVAIDAYHKSGFADGSTPDPSVSVYTSFDPIRDASVSRLAIFHNRSTNVEDSLLGSGELKRYAREHQPDRTAMIFKPVFWTPYESEHHPKYNQGLHQCAYGPRPFMLKGVCRVVGDTLFFSDDEPCPFHRGIGREVEAFKTCCKESYLKRVNKAEQTGNQFMGHVLYEPIEREEHQLHRAESKKASEHPDPRKRAYDLLHHLRIAYSDMGMVSMAIPPDCVFSTKKRIDEQIQFHAVDTYKWEFLGCTPLVSFPTGVMTFGSLELDPNTGDFKGEARTARGLYNLIREMKTLCRDARVLSAQLTMVPSHRIKPDPIALAQNEALLRENLDIEVTVKIDKQANANIRKNCGFCGMDDERRLCRCACKSQWYCCREHQKEHWPDHKAICKELQRAMKK